MGTATRRWLALWLPLALAWVGTLPGCVPLASRPVAPRVDPASAPPGLPPQQVAAVRREVVEQRYTEAERHVNQLLAKDPTQARLHLLNGLLYYRRFLAGDPTMADQAEAGLLMARQFDPGLALASYLLGLLYLDLGRFDPARLHLLEATTHQPRWPAALQALGQAAYHARDLPLAVWAVETYRDLRPDDLNGLRDGAVIYAAAGDAARARDCLQQLTAAGSADAARLTDRANAWADLLAEAMALAGTELAAADSAAPAAPPSSRPDAAPVDGARRTRAWNEAAGGSSAGGSGSGSYGAQGADEVPVIPALPSPRDDVPLPRMAILDVVLIRAEEIAGFSRGLNLTEGLSLVLGYNWSEARTTGSGDARVARTRQRSLGLPNAGLTYSLNIFTTGGSRAEVLARPSLLALDRVGSTFFSGSTVTVALAGQYSTSLQDKRIGIGLSATPTFVDDETMLLAVRASRSFVQPVQLTGLGASMTTSQNSVTANVLIRFGETMVLSGLREREVYSIRAGIPVLGRLPLVKYLFGREGQDQYTKHVLILVTPRRPERWADLAAAVPSERDELSRVAGRGSLPPAAAARVAQLNPGYGANLHAVLANLGYQRYCQEFRTGDMGRDRPHPEGLLEQVLSDLR